MTPPAPRESLWSWSLRTLEDATARRALLLLQDGHGLNGSLVLWALWCERAGLAVTGEAAGRIVAGVHGLDRYVVRRLREVRRYAASPRPGYDAAGLSALRREVYEAELAAERLIQERLEAETMAACAGASDAERTGEQGTGERLLAVCADALETPVLLADDLGQSGPTALFATLAERAPPLEQPEPS